MWLQKRGGASPSLWLTKQVKVSIPSSSRRDEVRWVGDEEISKNPEVKQAPSMQHMEVIRGALLSAELRLGKYCS